jgi:hypothetical protein
VRLRFCLLFADIRPEPAWLVYIAYFGMLRATSMHQHAAYHVSLDGQSPHHRTCRNSRCKPIVDTKSQDEARVRNCSTNAAANCPLQADPASSSQFWRKPTLQELNIRPPSHRTGAQLFRHVPYVATASSPVAVAPAGFISSAGVFLLHAFGVHLPMR